MILDAFRPFFGSQSTTCTCEVSVFTTQNTSVLHIQQEPSLLPTSNCGLSVKLTWGTQHNRVVNCNDFLDTEYRLPKGADVTLTLSSTSSNWSTGFCFAVNLRFGEYCKSGYLRVVRGAKWDTYDFVYKIDFCVDKSGF
jgi:hypothetical protein